MVETNYRVYAYTSSALQIATISLFVTLQTRFANMVVGLITRDSVREALAKGITADQMISYLTSHAHPEMKKAVPVLPTTVIDQIRLWEMERNRLRITEGSLYLSFGREQDYREALNYASTLDYVIWNSNEKKMFVLTTEGHEYVRAWIKSKTSQQQS